MGYFSQRLDPSQLPVRPLVEISGQKRVLIENHQGVCGYDRGEILVSVSYGTVAVRGSGLCLQRMTKEQLVICGCIHSIVLQGGEHR